MKLQTGNYLKTSEVNTGDSVTFRDEGDWVESAKYTYEDGTPRQDFVIKVSYKGEEKKMRLNKTNREILVSAWGDETSLWVGKTAMILKEKMLVAGKRMDCITLEVPGSDKTPIQQAGEEADQIPF